MTPVVYDAAVLVGLTARWNATILTGNPHEASRLVAAARAHIEIIRV
jgi:hypothetical protein